MNMLEPIFLKFEDPSWCVAKLRSHPYILSMQPSLLGGSIFSFFLIANLFSDSVGVFIALSLLSFANAAEPIQNHLIPKHVRPLILHFKAGSSYFQRYANSVKFWETPFFHICLIDTFLLRLSWGFHRCISSQFCKGCRTHT